MRHARARLEKATVLRKIASWPPHPASSHVCDNADRGSPNEPTLTSELCRYNVVCSISGWHSIQIYRQTPRKSTERPPCRHTF
jgi:hypothetical protein